MRRLASLSALGATIGALLMLPSGAGASVTYGISDQSPSTFTNSLYAPLKLKTARFITPYDVMTNPTEKQELEAWLAAATLAKQKVLLSVEHSRTAGQESKTPSSSEYKAAIKSIYTTYGKYVESFSAWNEVNVAQKGGRTEGQPPKIASSKTGPKIVAGYYKTAKSVWKGKKIVALDVLDGATKNVLGATKNYIRKFRKYSGSVKYWGLHNYSDTNRYSDSIKRTQQLLKEMKGGKVWLTETGGQLSLRGKNFGEAKAAKAIGCTIYIAKKYDSRVQRVYFYQFNGGNSDFDAGLISTANVPRKGYSYVKSRKSYKCKK